MSSQLIILLKDLFNVSLVSNTLNLQDMELEWIQTFFLETTDLNFKIGELLKKTMRDFDLFAIPHFIIDLVPIVKTVGKEIEMTNPRMTLLLIKFIVVTLIDNEVLRILSDEQSQADLLINTSINLLGINLDITETENVGCYKYFRKYFLF